MLLKQQRESGTTDSNLTPTKAVGGAWPSEVDAAPPRGRAATVAHSLGESAKERHNPRR
jgi:hypothetical protein